jgi:hypothetical protein
MIACLVICQRQIAFLVAKIGCQLSGQIHISEVNFLAIFGSRFSGLVNFWVSILAATLVTAGVYLIFRLADIMEYAPAIMALFAAVAL